MYLLDHLCHPHTWRYPCHHQRKQDYHSILHRKSFAIHPADKLYLASFTYNDLWCNESSLRSWLSSWSLLNSLSLLSSSLWLLLELWVIRSIQPLQQWLCHRLMRVALFAFICTIAWLTAAGFGGAGPLCCAMTITIKQRQHKLRPTLQQLRREQNYRQVTSKTSLTERCHATRIASTTLICHQPEVWVICIPLLLAY